MAPMEEASKKRRQRRSYTDEFRMGAVRLILDEGKTVSRVAQDLDLTPSALASWVKQARADRSNGKTGLTTEERAELAQLRRENRTLRLQRDILKKAAASSAGRCNDTGDSGPWREEAKYLAWPAVEPPSDHVEVVLTVG